VSVGGIGLPPPSLSWERSLERRVILLFHRHGFLWVIGTPPLSCLSASLYLVLLGVSTTGEFPLNLLYLSTVLSVLAFFFALVGLFYIYLSTDPFKKKKELTPDIGMKDHIPNLTLEEQIKWVDNELMDLSEDIAMGGGTGSNAMNNYENDPILKRDCDKYDALASVLRSLKELRYLKSTPGYVAKAG
jgi:hypothetical protein